MNNKTDREQEQKQREMVEEIASNIARLSREVKSILGGRLKKETIIVLLTHSTKLSQHNVKLVLDALVDMERIYLK